MIIFFKCSDIIWSKCIPNLVYLLMNFWFFMIKFNDANQTLIDFSLVVANFNITYQNLIFPINSRYFCMNFYFFKEVGICIWVKQKVWENMYTSKICSLNKYFLFWKIVSQSLLKWTLCENEKEIENLNFFEILIRLVGRPIFWSNLH